MNGASIPKDVAQPIGLPTIAGGLVRPLGGPRDLQDHQVYGIQNLIPYQGVLRTRPGRSIYGNRVSLTEPIIHLDNITWESTAIPTQLAIGTQHIWTHNDDGSWQEVLSYFGTAISADTHVTTAVIKNKLAEEIFFCTFQHACEVFWMAMPELDGHPNLLPLGNPGQYLRAHIVRVVNDHVVLLNVYDDSGPRMDRIRWSNYADPTDFNEQHGTAGLVDLNAPNADVKGRGGIVAAEPLVMGSETVLVIYQEWGVHTMRWVGSPALFSFKTIIPDEGAVSPRSVVPVLTKEGPAHIVFGRRGIYMHRGDGNFIDISQDRIMKYLVDYGVTGTNRYRIFGYDRPNDFRVDFHLPMTMDPSLTWDTSPDAKWDTPLASLATWDPARNNVIFSYNYLEDTWTYLSVSHDDVLCAAPKTIREHSFMMGVNSDSGMYGTSDGYVLEDEADTGVDELDTYNFTCRVDTKQFVGFDTSISGSRKVRIERVGIEAKGSGQMEIYMKYDEDEWVLCRTVTLTSTYDIWWIYPETSCEYYQISVRCGEWEDDDEEMQPSYMWIKQILRDVIPGTGR